VDNALVVQVHETLEDLRDIDSDEVLGELSESFANVVQRTVLAESGDAVRNRHVREENRGCAYSRMMYKYSGVFTKPLYLTMLGC